MRRLQRVATRPPTAALAGVVLVAVAACASPTRRDLREPDDVLVVECWIVPPGSPTGTWRRQDALPDGRIVELTPAAN